MKVIVGSGSSVVVGETAGVEVMVEAAPVTVGESFTGWVAVGVATKVCVAVTDGEPVGVGVEVVVPSVVFVAVGVLVTSVTCKYPIPS